MKMWLFLTIIIKLSPGRRQCVNYDETCSDFLHIICGKFLGVEIDSQLSCKCPIVWMFDSV